MNKQVQLVIDKIKEKYPDIYYSLEKDNIDNEYYIVIHDLEVYESTNFQLFLIDLNANFIMANSILDIFVIYGEQKYRSYSAESLLFPYSEV